MRGTRGTERSTSTWHSFAPEYGVNYCIEAPKCSEIGGNSSVIGASGFGHTHFINSTSSPRSRAGLPESGEAGVASCSLHAASISSTMAETVPQSWVVMPPNHPFSLQNLPWGVFRPKGFNEARIGVAIGDLIVDVGVLAKAGLVGGTKETQRHDCFHQSTLNAFMAAGPATWRLTRTQLQHLLSADCPTLRDAKVLKERTFHKQSDVTMELPAVIGDYTDFYSSEYHAANCGRLFRPQGDSLPQNWGQVAPQDPEEGPTVKLCEKLDFELEMACLIGPGNKLGSSIPIDQAVDHVFGFVLLNDWSARDIQQWESAPLGPFLGKSFATSISPWVVTLDALEPFLCPGVPQHPLPLEYLRTSMVNHTVFDIALTLSLRPEGAEKAALLCETNYRHLYWSLAQQVTHHTVNGCNLRTGDLLGTGTISGPEDGNRGSLLEMSQGGRVNVALGGSSEVRRFLRDGDEVVIEGICQGDGYAVGFGQCTGRILGAQDHGFTRLQALDRFVHNP